MKRTENLNISTIDHKTITKEAGYETTFHTNASHDRGVSQWEPTDVTDELVDVRLLQQAQLAHAGQRVERLVDHKLLRVTQTLLQQGLQDGRALPAHVRSHAWTRTHTHAHTRTHREDH